MVRRKFFTQRAVRPWHGLPREAVGAPSLEVLRSRLDGAMANPVWWVAPLPRQGVGTR